MQPDFPNIARLSARLAIGTPADGFYALKVMRETGGAAEDVTDEEIREGMKWLAECEGIFAETAGGDFLAQPPSSFDDAQDDRRQQHQRGCRAEGEYLRGQPAQPSGARAKRIDVA